MKCSRSARQTSHREGGFTLVELSIAMVIAVAFSLAAYSVLRSGMMLSSQNLGINVSSLRGRTIIDQIGEKVRYSMEQPILVNADGTVATGTSADGLLTKKFIGAPYVVKDASGGTSDLATTATQFVVEFRADLPAPSVGDYILMESVSRPELEIASVTTLSATGTTQRRQITTTAATGELIHPASYRVSGLLYRKEAYIFVDTDATSNPRAELRHFQRVRGNTNYSSSANYVVIATGYRGLSTQPYFLNSTSNGAVTTTLQAVVNSSTRQEVVSRGSTVSTFTSLPVRVRLWSLNR